MSDILTQYKKVAQEKLNPVKEEPVVVKRTYSKEQLLLFKCFKECFEYKYIVKDGLCFYAYYKKPVYDKDFKYWDARRNDFSGEQEISNDKVEALLELLDIKDGECFKIP